MAWTAQILRHKVAELALVGASPRGHLPRSPLPSRSDQAQQKRAPEEESQDRDGECLTLLADENFDLSDHSSYLA